MRKATVVAVGLGLLLHSIPTELRAEALSREHVPEPLQDEPEAETPAIAVPDEDETATAALKH